MLAGRYNTEQLLDLIFMAGQYRLVSMALNSCGVQLEDGFEGFPDEVYRVKSPARLGSAKRRVSASLFERKEGCGDFLWLQLAQGTDSLAVAARLRL